VANFIPLKNYMLYLIDKLVDRYGVQGPFLDCGCGQGDVTLHFAEKGWSGTALDISKDAVEACRDRVAGYGDIAVECGEIGALKGAFKAIILLDVVEHVPDDKGLLAAVHAKMSPAGHLILSVPIKPGEWRWDDDYYGHLRRYKTSELKSLLDEVGFKVLETWDCTFPIFWIMRRLYTYMSEKKIPVEMDSMERTKQSPFKDAWGGAFGRILNNNLWRPIFPILALFKNSQIGFEVIVLAQKKG
jgi:SAM-dependent methyltransferase